LETSLGQFKEKSNTLGLLPQLLLRGLRRIKNAAHCRMREQSLGHHRKKVNFFGGIEYPELYLQR